MLVDMFTERIIFTEAMDPASPQIKFDIINLLTMDSPSNPKPGLQNQIGKIVLLKDSSSSKPRRSRPNNNRLVDSFMFLVHIWIKSFLNR